MQVTRRRFLAAIAALAAACSKRSAPPGLSAVPDAAPRVLGAAERRALEAFFARIIPSDDGPGAREAGVIDFLETQLGTPEIRPLLRAVQGTARLLDGRAGEKHGRPLAELSPADQDAVLEELATGKIAAAPKFPQREVFRVLHSLALEGYLGDPAHGGNAGMVGWRAVGFPEPGLRTPGGAHTHGR